MRKRLIACVALGFVFLSVDLPATAQDPGLIDLYFSDWHGVAQRSIRGSLQLQQIFVRGNPQSPAHKGEVLRFINSYAYATLAPNTSTESARLDGQQEVYFVASGHGKVAVAAHSDELFPNVAILVPAKLEFTITNTGAQPLTMYVINEPVPAGFRPNSRILVRDGNKLPISSSDGHWAHIVTPLFTTEDGLGTFESILTVALDPLTMGRPHVVDHDDIEEVWQALDGTSIAFVGNQLRKQTPGMAFYHIPDNKTPHTNINQNEDSQVRFLYFARYHPHETRK